MDDAAEYPEIAIRLTVELVPKTCWFSNVRDHVGPEVWDRLRREVYARANNRCEICGGRGREWPVECHEIWRYDDERRIQTLTGLIALCLACHGVKHMGLSELRGRGEPSKAHLARVNGWTMSDVELYMEVVWEQWSWRSTQQWRLDLSWLEQRGVHVTPKR